MFGLYLLTQRVVIVSLIGQFTGLKMVQSCKTGLFVSVLAGWVLMSISAFGGPAGER